MGLGRITWLVKMKLHTNGIPEFLIVWQRFCEPARLRIAYCPWVRVSVRVLYRIQKVPAKNDPALFIHILRQTPCKFTIVIALCQTSCPLRTVHSTDKLSEHFLTWQPWSVTYDFDLQNEQTCSLQLTDSVYLFNTCSLANHWTWMCSGFLDKIRNNRIHRIWLQIHGAIARQY